MDIVDLSFQMDPVGKFAEVASCPYVSVGSLQVDRPYPITHAERIGTKFGPSIGLCLLDSPTHIITKSSFLDVIIQSLLTKPLTR